MANLKITGESEYDKVLISNLWLAWKERPTRGGDAAAAVMGMEIESAFKKTGVNEPKLVEATSVFSGVMMEFIDAHTGAYTRTSIPLNKAKELLNELHKIVPKEYKSE